MPKASKKRGGRTTAPQTTARSGKTKSAKARAVSHERQSSGAGRVSGAAGKSRTVAEHASAARTQRGPGDVGLPPGEKLRRRHAAQRRQPGLR